MVPNSPVQKINFSEIISPTKNFQEKSHLPKNLNCSNLLNSLSPLITCTSLCHFYVLFNFVASKIVQQYLAIYRDIQTWIQLLMQCLLIFRCQIRHLRYLQDGIWIHGAALTSQQKLLIVDFRQSEQLVLYMLHCDCSFSFVFRVYIWFMQNRSSLQWYLY